MSPPLFTLRLLQEEIGLKDHTHVFLNMMANLRDMAGQCFDFNSSWQQNKEAWENYEQQVCKIYPRFLRGPRGKTCRRYLQTYIARYIGNISGRMNKMTPKQQRTYIQKKRGVSVEPSVDPSRSPSVEPANRCPSPSPPPATGMVLARRESVPRVDPSPGSSRSQSNPSTEAPPYAVLPSVYPNCPRSDPLQKTKAFLARCRPCLSYLLPSFMQLGFCKDDFLDGVMQWPKHELVLVLEKWKLAGRLTDLEAETLRIAFRQRQEGS